MSSDEVLQRFVRRLARMFCDDSWEVIIIDMLAKHAPLSVAQLAALLKESKPRMRRICRRLQQQRFLTMHRSDTPARAVDDQDGPDWFSRRDAAEDDAVWYIDYADVINAVHFRLLKIHQKIQSRETSFESRKIFS